jgi:hypothetical protein
VRLFWEQTGDHGVPLVPKTWPAYRLASTGDGGAKFDYSAMRMPFYDKLGIENVGTLMTRGVMIGVAVMKGVEVLPGTVQQDRRCRRLQFASRRGTSPTLIRRTVSRRSCANAALKSSDPGRRGRRTPPQMTYPRSADPHSHLRWVTVRQKA